MTVEPEPAAPTRPGWVEHGRTWLEAHETTLWWLHSLWALAFGMGVMWLGARHYTWLRGAMAYVVVIWVASLALPWVSHHPRLSPRTRRLTLTAINYFNRGFYQQLLFFVLPIYYASTTRDSINVVFPAVVAVSAVLASLDVVYDRHLSVRRGVMAVFFAFNLFACVNVALPVLWAVSNANAMRISAVLALLGFVTLRYPARALGRWGVLAGLLASAVVLGALLEWGRRVVPPAPLRVVSGEFGREIDRRNPTIVGRFDEVPGDWRGRVYVQTAVLAPLGLEDRLRHRWVVDGVTVHATPYYAVAGGRERGFRLWSYYTFNAPRPHARIVVDVETESGQLVGRTAVRFAGQPPEVEVATPAPAASPR